MTTSANFSFLAAYDAQLVRLGAMAERYFKEDPVTSLIKLRKYSEVLAQVAAAKAGLYRDPMEGQAEILRRIDQAFISVTDLRWCFARLIFLVQTTFQSDPLSRTITRPTRAASQPDVAAVGADLKTLIA